MLKTVDVPQYLREFNSLFSLIGRKHDISRVFDDFLTLVICVLARQTQEDWYHDTIRKYDKDELNHFAKVLGTLFMIYDKEIASDDWIDPLGDYYEALASNHKKSGFGQFFTPKGICDLMAEITINKNDFGNKINDPTAGSGRTFLAANKVCKGNYYVAQDLDHMCVKMCCINMAIHGLKGEVYHMDTLRNNSPWNTYIINHDWHKTKTPFIYKQKKAD
jgi:type I restriction enzyme M protein